MNNLFDKKTDCCGCELCSQVCPKSLIEMRQDPEGFFYPYITDSHICIDCHRCESVCPERNRIIPPRQVKSYYSGYSKTEYIIKSCASGGLATELSASFIKQGGIVYGVKYSSNCEDIEYGRADDIDGLSEFKGSKYAQARKNLIYREILSDLKQGRRVLFIGLPCDVAAVYNYTKNKYDNLYTIELVCHGVTSPLVHKQYIEKESRKHKSTLENFSVRYKKKGWKPYFVYELFETGLEKIYPFRPTAYGIAFHYLKRPSCNSCRFKIYDDAFGLQADITIGDNHGVEKKSDSFHPWGSSMAITHTNKGEELINSIRGSFNVYEDNEAIVSHNLALRKPFPQKANRTEFAGIFVAEDVFEACKLRSVRNAEVKRKVELWVTNTIITTCVTLGIENFRRKCTRKLRSFLKG